MFLAGGEGLKYPISAALNQYANETSHFLHGIDSRDQRVVLQCRVGALGGSGRIGLIQGVAGVFIEACRKTRGSSYL